jgi:hypothetical protein
LREKHLLLEVYPGVEPFVVSPRDRFLRVRKIF